MANFMTVSLECRTDEVQHTFKSILSDHREFVLKQTRGSGIADLVILELDEYNPQRTFADVTSMLTAAPHTEIAVTAKRSDPQTLLEAFRLGVKEFLPQPLSHDDVEQALVRSKTRFLSRSQDGNVMVGEVVCVVGGKSGVGTSTIALNLAVALTSMGQDKTVALLDLDIEHNDLALFLDLSAPRGLHDLAVDLSRLDQAIVQSVLVKHSSGVQLLAAGGGQTPPDSLTPGCVMYTLDLLRSLFDYVVIDGGHRVTQAVKEALEVSSRVLIVGCLDVPTITRTKRLVYALQQSNRFGKPISLVLNRYAAKQQDLLKQAEESLQMKATWFIANDYVTVSRSLDAGTPLVQSSPKGTLAKQYKDYAGTIITESSRQQEAMPDEAHSWNGKPSSLLGRLWPVVWPHGKAKTESI